jgi:hypothetical protein
VVLLCACGGGGDAATPADSTGADSLGDPAAIIAAPDTALPPMPGIPDRRSGHLVAVGVGAHEFSEAWPARAGRCARPPLIIVLPRELGNTGGTVLLELAAGEPTVDYPVAFADSTGMPEPPAAMLGFQFFTDQRGDAYQAVDGVVTVYRLDERTVSGRFQVTVRHINTNARARVAGVFHELEVEPLPPDYCEQAQAAQDSLATGRN